MAASAALVGVRPALAASATWSATPSDNNWVPLSGDTNWSTGVNAYPGSLSVLTNPDVATFNSTSTYTTLNISTGLDVGGITFDTAATSYTIGGAGANGGPSLLLSSGGIVQITSTFSGTGVTQTINAPVVLEPASSNALGAYNFSNNSATTSNALVFAGNITGGTTSFQNTTDVAPNEGGSIVLTLGGANTGLNVVSGVISDGGALTGTSGGNTPTAEYGVAINKVGAGTWYLTGANTYTGETAIIGGILNVASLSNYGVPSAIGARTAAEESTAHGGIGLLLAGGTLQYTGSANQSTNRQVRLGQATSYIDSSGTGYVQFTYNAAGTSLYQVAGVRTLTLTGSNTGANLFSEWLAPQSTNVTALAKAGAGNWTYAGIDSGIDTVSVGGTGSLTLTGANTYTGATTISSGATLILSGANTLGATAVTLNNGGFLQLQANAANETTNASTGVITSSAFGTPSAFYFTSGSNPGATLQLRSDQTVTFANSGATSNTGTTTLIYDVNNFGGSDTTTGKTLTAGGFATYQTIVNVTGGSGYTLGLPSITNANGAFLDFNTISANLSLGSVVNGSTLQFNASAGTGITTTGTLAASSTTAVMGAGNTTIAGVLSGTTLTKTGTGTLTLGAANTYSAATAINGGTVDISAATNLGATATTISFNGGTLDSTANTYSLGTSRAITLNGAGTIQVDAGALTVNGAITNNANLLTVQGAGNTVISGAIGSGAGGLTKAGAGTLTLSNGADAFTGPTTINAGVVNVTGALTGTSGVTVAAGTLSGTGTIAGPVTVNPGAAIDFTKDGLSLATTTLTLQNGLTVGTGSGAAANLTFNIGGSGTDLINVTGGSFNVLAGSTPDLVNLNAIGTLATGTNNPYNLVTFGSGNTNLPLGTPSTSLIKIGTQPAGLYSFTLNVTPTALQVLETANPTPVTAYWTGKYDTVWSDFNATGPVTNFASNATGTTDAGQLPSAGTDVVFTATTNGLGTSLAGTAVTTTLGASFIIDSLTVNGTPSSVTIGNLAAGNTLTLNAAGSGAGGLGYAAGTGLVVQGGAGPVTINTTTLVPASSQSWNNGSASPLTIASAVTGAASASNVTTLTLANTNTGGTTLSGVIGDGPNGGALAVVVNNTGTGPTSFSGTNTYSGGTTLTGGTLVGGTGSFGTGNVTVAPTGATGTAVDNAALTSVNSISSNAVVTLTSATSDGGFGIATVNFNGSSPTVAALNGNGNVALNNPGGTVLTIGTISGTNANAASTFSGVISEGTAGEGSLVKAGTGTLTLSGSVANTYTGSTSITAGKTYLADTATPGNAISGTTLSVTGPSTYLILSGNEQIADNAVVTLDTNAHFVLNGYTETIAGLNSGSAGTNSLAEGAELAAPAAIASVLQIGGAGNYSFDGILRDHSTGYTATLALVMNGTGTQTLTNTGGQVGMTFTGGATINNGTLALVDNGNGVTITNFASAVTDNATFSLADTLSGNTVTFSRVISTTGSGNLVVPATNLGTVALTQAETYGGTTNVSGGTLALGNGASGNDGSLVTTGVLDNATLTYNLYGSQAPTYNISGTGNLTKTGPGTLTLSVPTMYTGKTTISAGTLVEQSTTLNTAVILHNGGTLQLQSTPANTNGFNCSAMGLTNSLPATNAPFQFSDGTAGGSATLQLRSDASVTFLGTASGNSTGFYNTLIYDVNNFGGADATQNMTLSVGALSTYFTTINVTGGNGYTLNLAGIANGNGAGDTFNALSANLTLGPVGYSGAVTSLAFNASGGNIAATGAITNTGATTVTTAANYAMTISGALAGTSLTSNGAGALILTASNSYTGGTTINGGTVFANSAVSSTGNGSVVVNAAGTLAGNGSTGSVTVNGTIAAGATNNSSGTLTTGVQAWNTSTGQFLAKVYDASNTSGGVLAGNDRLVMSGLSTIASGFAVNISTSLSSLPAGTVLVLADDTEGAGTNPFNTGGVAPSALVLEVNGSSATATADGLSLGTQLDALGHGGYDLVLESTPEPTSLLLAGLAAAPLALGRRRSRRRSVAVAS